MEKYLNPSLTPEERAADLLSKMSLEEKMGQLSCVFARDLASLPRVPAFIPYGNSFRRNGLRRKSMCRQ